MLLPGDLVSGSTTGVSGLEAAVGAGHAFRAE